MAVKIISEGRLKTYKIKCFHCNSVLEFTNLDELSEYDSDVPFEGQCMNWYIKCPKCNRDVPTRAVTDMGSYDWRIDDSKEKGGYVRKRTE